MKIKRFIDKMMTGLIVIQIEIHLQISQKPAELSFVYKSTGSGKRFK